MRKTLIFFIILLGLSSSWAQDPDSDLLELSLQDAIVYGLKNNYQTKNAAYDVAIALKQKWQIISQGLPQIKGAVDYQNYLKQPVTLLPGELAGGEPGTFVPVTFGTKQSLNATTTWNQLIFDGSYILGIQSARTLLQITENAKVKTDLEIKQAIIDAYGNVLLATESVAILEKNLAIVEKNLNDTQAIYENGLTEEEDVEQLQITYLGLETNLNNSKRMQAIAYDMLKVTIGVPLEKEIQITDELNDLALQYYDLSLLQKQVSVEENIDYRMAKDLTNQAEILVKYEKSKSLPSLTGFVNYGFQGYNDEFKFFNEDQEFFKQSVLGLSLNIPIFSSGMRSANTAQKQLEYKKQLEELEYTRNQVKLQIENARNDYQFTLDNYNIQQKNLSLAERIEEKNRIKFFEGIASSFELSEAQSQLFSAQQTYLQSMLDLITSKSSLEKVLDTTQYQPQQ